MGNPKPPHSTSYATVPYGADGTEAQLSVKTVDGPLLQPALARVSQLEKQRGNVRRYVALLLRSRRVPAAAAVVVDLLAAPATATAGAWMLAPPQPIGRAQALSLAGSFSPRGPGVLTWDRTGASYLREKSVVSVDGAGVIGRLGVVKRRGLQLAGAADSRGRVWAAWVAPVAGQVSVAQVGPDGQLGRAQFLKARGVASGGASVVGASDGSALVYWMTGTKTRDVWVATRRPGRVFGRPRVVATVRTSQLLGDVGGGRWALTAVVAGSSRLVADRVQAWGGTLTSTRQIRTSLGAAPNEVDLVSKIDGRGRAWVTWRSQTSDQEEPARWTQRLATFGPTGSRLAKVIASGAGSGSGSPALAASPLGGAVLLMGIDRANRAAELRIVVGTRRGSFSRYLRTGRSGRT